MLLKINAEWSNDDMIRIARITGLSRSQVYKWHWDQKHKFILPESQEVYVIQLDDESNDPKTGQIVFRSPSQTKKLQNFL